MVSKVSTQILGQVRVLSTQFWKIKGQKDKLKGHKYSFFDSPKGFIRHIFQNGQVTSKLMVHKKM